MTEEFNEEESYAYCCGETYKEEQSDQLCKICGCALIFWDEEDYFEDMLFEIDDDGE